MIDWPKVSLHIKFWLDEAGLVKWYNNSFPNCGRGFDSPIPHISILFLRFAESIIEISVLLAVITLAVLKDRLETIF